MADNLSISGKFKVTADDKQRLRRALHDDPKVFQRIEDIGFGVANVARQNATTAASSSTNKRFKIVPLKIGFKDIRDFTSKKNRAGYRSGEPVSVGLVVSDSRWGFLLEFGGEGQPPTGFMRAAAMKASKMGVKFFPPKKGRK